MDTKIIKPPVEKHSVRIAVAKGLAETIVSKKLAELTSQGFEALLPIADLILAAVRHAEIYGRHWQDTAVDRPGSELQNLDAFDKVALIGWIKPNALCTPVRTSNRKENYEIDF